MRLFALFVCSRVDTGRRPPVRLPNGLSPGLVKQQTKRTVCTVPVLAIWSALQKVIIC